MLNRTPLAITVPALAVALVLSGCSASAAQTEAKPQRTITASGVVTVPLENYATQRAAGLAPTAKIADVADGSPCVLAAGFEDLSAGSQIVVKSSEGKLLGKGELGNPTVESTAFGRCVLPFTVSDVPVQGDGLYELFAGSSTRGSVASTGADLTRGDLVLKVG